MGSKQSTRAASEIKEHQEVEAPPCSVSGRKQSNEDRILEDVNVISTSDDDVAVGASDDDGTESEYETDSDEEDDDEWNERIRVLSDAKDLKKFAMYFMHPEQPVVRDAFVSARCYFSRPSAPEQTSLDDEDELHRILSDCLALKKLASDYLHPEKPIVVDGTACARNYFSRPGAPNNEEETYRQQVLEDTAALKKFAVDYMHPELPVITSDPCATGRNFFSRPSAPEYEDEEYMDERDEIMEDMMALKKLAQDYLQPERPVEVDALASCRNYFDRASAAPQESFEEAEERARILADAAALKKFAVDYMHPELPVITSDPCATGRNFFSRPSAPEYEDAEEDAERSRILEEMSLMKKLAEDYMHPEKPVKVDAFASARNYFSRPSAVEYEEKEMAAERDRVLEDITKLKKYANFFLHPEDPVDMGGPEAFGRNYFDRPSAPGHADQIQTEAVVDGMHKYTYDANIEHHHHMYDQRYYHYHMDDHMHSDYHSQSDHFEMDEDVAHVFGEFRQSVQSMVPLKGAEIPKEADEEQEGKLSRSPSSIMLFEEAAM